MLLVYILSCFGFKVGSWVVLVCAFGLILSQTSFSFFYYSLFSEWIGIDEISLLIVVLGILVIITGVVSRFKDIKLKKNIGRIDATRVVEMVTIITLGRLVFFSVCRWIDFFFWIFSYSYSYANFKMGLSTWAIAGRSIYNNIYCFRVSTSFN